MKTQHCLTVVSMVEGMSYDIEHSIYDINGDRIAGALYYCEYDESDQDPKELVQASIADDVIIPTGPGMWLYVAPVSLREESMTGLYDLETGDEYLQARVAQVIAQARRAHTTWTE